MFAFRAFHWLRAAPQPETHSDIHALLSAVNMKLIILEATCNKVRYVEVFVGKLIWEHVRLDNQHTAIR